MIALSEKLEQLKAMQTPASAIALVELYKHGNKVMLHSNDFLPLRCLVSAWNGAKLAQEEQERYSRPIPKYWQYLWIVDKLSEVLAIGREETFWMLTTDLNSENIAMDQVTEIEMKIAQLREQLLKDTPALPTILQQIKMYLSKNPEVVTLLSEEQIGEIVQAAQRVSQVKIVEAAMKGRGGKKLKDLELEDLM